MIKFTLGQTEKDIRQKLDEYFAIRPIIPKLPTITYSDVHPEMNLNFLSNLGKLSQLLYFGLRSSRAQEFGWHVMLDVTETGFTVAAFTNKDEVEVPRLLDDKVAGSC